MESKIQPNISPAQPLPQTTPSSPPTNKWSRVLLFIVAGVIVVAGSVLIGIQISKSQSPSQQPIPIQPTASPTQTVLNPTTEPISNSTEDWETYTNTVHKYSIKYPDDWIIDSSNADNIETYEDSVCCNTALLTISNGLVTWELRINQLYTGFQAPDECQPGPNQCSIFNKPMTILGHQVNRKIYRLNASDKIISVEMVTPNRHPGFGQIGFSTPHVDASHIKYFLEYSGSEIDKYIDTLDTISTSLKTN